MPTIHKPRYGWKGSGSYEGLILSQENFDDIKKVLGIKRYPRGFEDLLQFAISEYFVNKDFFKNFPDTPEIKAGLKLINSKTRKAIKTAKPEKVKELRNLLDNIDGRTRDLIRSFINFQDPSTILKNPEGLERIMIASEKAMLILKNKEVDSGRHRKIDQPHWKMLVSHLAKLFEMATGNPPDKGWWEGYKERHYGSFFNFVKTVSKLDPEFKAGIYYQSEQSLGKSIQRILKITEKSSSSLPRRIPTIPE